MAFATEWVRVERTVVFPPAARPWWAFWRKPDRWKHRVVSFWYKSRDIPVDKLEVGCSVDGGIRIGSVTQALPFSLDITNAMMEERR